MLVVGVPGAIVGFVIGLNVYAPTAWAAMFEIGIPAAAVGGLVGLLVGCVISMVKRRFGGHRVA